MDIRTRERSKLDRTDIEFLKQTCATRGWQLFQDRVKTMLETERAGLEAASEVREVQRLQGSISTLRRVLELPTIMEAELRKRGG